MSATDTTDVPAPLSPVAPEQRGGLSREVLLVLGLSLGSSAVYAVLAIADRLTKEIPLSGQSSSLNN